MLISCHHNMYSFRLILYECLSVHLHLNAVTARVLSIANPSSVTASVMCVCSCYQSRQGLGDHTMTLEECTYGCLVCIAPWMNQDVIHHVIITAVMSSIETKSFIICDKCYGLVVSEYGFTPLWAIFQKYHGREHQQWTPILGIEWNAKTTRLP